MTRLHNGFPAGSSRQTDYLQLAGGARIYYPEDLLTVVPENSATARAATESASSRSTSRVLQGAGIGVGLIGMGIAVAPLLAPKDVRDPNFGNQIDSGMKQSWLGLGIAAVGVLTTVVGRMVFGQNADDEAATAYETYNDSLRLRLGVGEQRTRSEAAGATPAVRSGLLGE